VNESGVMNVTMMNECGAVRMNIMVLCVEEWEKDGKMEECNPGNLEGVQNHLWMKEGATISSNKTATKHIHHKSRLREEPSHPNQTPSSGTPVKPKDQLELKAKPRRGKTGRLSILILTELPAVLNNIK